jgi:hypothetical protein
MLGGGGTLVPFDEFESALKKYDATSGLFKIYSDRLNIDTKDLEWFGKLETINGSMTDHPNPGHKNKVNIDELEDKLKLTDFDELVQRLKLDDKQKQEWKDMFDKMKAVFASLRPDQPTDNLPPTTNPVAATVQVQNLEANTTTNPVVDLTNNQVKPRVREMLPIPKQNGNRNDDTDMAKRNKLATLKHNEKMRYLY